ncbi:SDR family NAD(P)-dependent oxidoreductase [Megasphaera paucivorans]|uniref:NAD(P)-dependent dehydrogenase, short-chain alcohol dehydrogenase family n=1 Tax=Megasphaera paucivorans TaxID=349095 RepID=A0A1G9U0C1_9FIRM|nr:SDR family oxidoreductase [Megasphaera paucivorans]SDM52985.1 NAD(P)-dependent dehydrogenase, short-chain alcohol dehydrogenase family [Megasphaera paucivorans]
MEEKVALISGGTSGIGLACAAELLKCGWRVAINGRSKTQGEKALHILSVLPSRAVYIQGDVMHDEECCAMVDKTIACFGRMDGLITSAGVYEEQLLEETVPEDVLRLFTTNVFGTISLCRYALPHLKKNKGSIVTLGSDAGLQGNVGCAVYCATKGAVVAFTKSLALEAAPHGVRVNCVCPGDVATPMLDRQLQKNPELSIASMKALYPLYRIAEPEEIAKAAVFLLGENASFITAVALPVDGGLTSW